MAYGMRLNSRSALPCLLLPDFSSLAKACLRLRLRLSFFFLRPLATFYLPTSHSCAFAQLDPLPPLRQQVIRRIVIVRIPLLRRDHDFVRVRIQPRCPPTE
jgi:hypothetical protein